MSFTIGSLFSGSGGFELAATMCGGTPKWASEIEPYPISVTKSRFPDLKHLGSVTDIKGGEIEPVDVITFGSPCQDLSVAGKRAGLKHTDNGDDETTRSGLFMEAIRIIKEMREATNGKYPKFAVWENVPGAFSSNRGEDFRIVLEELIKIVEPSAVMPEVPQNGWAYADSYCGDGWSLAYRVLDAQHWGVPQRRRRIYLVLDLRGQCARKISFEREGLRGHFETGRPSWQTVTEDAEGGSGTADCEGKCYSIDHVITTGGNCTAQGSCVYENVCPTLKAGGCHAVACGFDGYNSCDTGDKAATLGVNCGMSTGRNGVVQATGINGDIAGTLDASYHKGCGMRQGVEREVVAFSINHQGGNVEQIIEEQTGTLTAAMNSSGNNKLSVAYPVAFSLDPVSSNSMKSSNPHSGCRQTEIARTIDTTDPNPCKNQGGIAVVEAKLMDAYQHHGYRENTVCGTLTAGQNDGIRGDTPLVCVPYTLKIRSGCEGGGKGALIQEGKSATLACNNDQYLFQPIGFDSYNLHSTGDKTISIRCKGDNEHQPVVAQPLCFEPGAASRLGGYCYEEKCGTLRATMGDNQFAVAYSIENHPADSRVDIDESGKVQTLTSRMGTGGGNVPMVLEQTVEAQLASGKDVAMSDRHTMDFQTYQKVTGPLMAHGGGCGYDGQDAFSDMLVAGVDSRNATEYPEMTGALQAGSARNLNSNNVVRVQYIVRRLTPTECARLQGFPDKWGHPIYKTEFTDEEYQFWLNVRKTHEAIQADAVIEDAKRVIEAEEKAHPNHGMIEKQQKIIANAELRKLKDYTKEQILKWYNGLHTDSSEYKMWDNGIALPNALYIMQGIAEVMSEEKAALRKWLDDLLK